MSRIWRTLDSTMKEIVTVGWVFKDNNVGVDDEKLIIHAKS